MRRYEHERPGSLVHADVKKLGNVPDGGGWRYVGRAQGMRQGRALPPHPGRQMGLQEVLLERLSPPRFLPAWLHNRITTGPNTALGNSAPITRLINVPEQYN